MKKYLALGTMVLTLSTSAMAQSAMDGYNISQSDIKGTARFMSMGGAFTALGGDLSTLSQNPAGIGIYRSTELGFTLDLDCQSSTAKCQTSSANARQTPFLLNNIGGVATWRLNSSTVPNINFGFTYNKAASFNRKYCGMIPVMNTSMSNYIAGISNANQLTVGDVESSYSYDPYNPDDGGYVAPWISILGYDSYLVTPETSSDGSTHWTGLYGEGTTAEAYFSNEIKGGVDEYNIAFGGNISNIVYWGMDFGITDLNYSSYSYYTERLTNAYADNQIATEAQWDLANSYSVSAQGFNYKLGVIVKPIQELRLGFAFHTPTWYSCTETFYADTEYRYNGTDIKPGGAQTDNGLTSYNDYNFRTPWRLTFGVAGVIGNNLIVSADYEWKSFNGMHFSDKDQYYWNGWDYITYPTGNSYQYVNEDIKTYYKATNQLRLGAEYRITPHWSVRAGYSYTSSPVTSEAKSGNAEIWTSGTNPSYAWDNSTNYVSCGIGYKTNHFYVDAAYMYKHYSSDYHVFADDVDLKVPVSTISNNDSQVVLSMGFKF